MKADIEDLYRRMLRARFFEEALVDLWEKGLISGEMHVGIGEEAVAAGVVSHLGEGDAMAVDHRSTPPLVARGVDLVELLLEMLGDEKGLCAGRGGHMHLFYPRMPAASSGIVGASGPMGAGFALAAKLLRPGTVSVSFFGEGAMNQGMLLETLNLASAWKLPHIFVCKDNGWAITTRSRRVTGGDLARRASSFGIPVKRVDGRRVEAVWAAAGTLVSRARRGGGPGFLLARCPRPEGHFLGDPLLRVYREPLRQAVEIFPSLIRSLAGSPRLRTHGRRRRSPSRSGAASGRTAASSGPPVLERLAAFGSIGADLVILGTEKYLLHRDPLAVASRRLPPAASSRIREEVRGEVHRAVREALERREKHA